MEIIVSTPTAPEAHSLIEALSGELEKRTGSNGKTSFHSEDTAHDRAVFLIALEAGEAIGCGAFRPIDEKTCEIKRMFAKYQGRGIGKAMLRALEIHALKLGYQEAWLETRKVNQQAVQFYLGQGYQVRPNYGRYVGREEAICFRKAMKLSVK